MSDILSSTVSHTSGSAISGLYREALKTSRILTTLGMQKDSCIKLLSELEKSDKLFEKRVLRMRAMNKNMTCRIERTYNSGGIISCGLIAILCSSLFAVFGHAAPAMKELTIAEGFGAGAAGGRGGRVITVTNLNDGGPGSLRDALSARGPRIIRFVIGGNIELKSPLVVTEGRVTLDGETAPGQGYVMPMICESFRRSGAAPAVSAEAGSSMRAFYHCC